MTAWRTKTLMAFTILLAMAAAMLVTRQAGAQKQEDPKPSSYTSVIEEPFDVVPTELRC